MNMVEKGSVLAIVETERRADFFHDIRELSGGVGLFAVVAAVDETV